MRKLTYTSNKNLTWNVYVYNFNKQCIETYNVLGKNSVIISDIFEKAKKEYKNEVIISAWPPNDNAKDEKVDVYSQIMLNFDIFYDYVYKNLFLIKQ